MEKLIKFLLVVLVAVGVIGVGLTTYARTSGSAAWLAVSSGFNTIGVPFFVLGLLAVAVVAFVRNRRTVR